MSITTIALAAITAANAIDTTAITDTIDLVQPEAHSEVVKCSRCWKEFDEEEIKSVISQSTGDYELYCEDCLEDITHFTCDKCGKIFIGEARTSYNGEDVCDECLNEMEADEEIYYCEHCGDWDYATNMYTLRGDGGSLEGHICRECRRLYGQCASCGEYIADGCEHYDEGEYLCDDCYSSQFSPENWDDHTDYYIHEYSYAPELVFHACEGEPETETTRYFGFELEVDEADDYDNANDCINELYEGEKHYWTHHDGSLHYYGFELTTMPMTLAYHHQYDWKSVLDTLKEHMRAADSCGFHVHVSSDSASYTTWKNLEYFVTRNKELFECIAGRGEGRWCVYLKRPYEECGTYNNERYRAINFQNSDTVEFRIFSSELEYYRLMGRLEFIDCLIEFISCYDNIEGFNELSNTMIMTNFTEFLTLNREKYKYIAEFFSHGYVFDTIENIIKA